MFPDFLQESETGLEFLGHGGHPSHGGLLEHLAAVKTVGVLHEADVVLGDIIDQRAGRVQVPQSQLIVVLVIQHVDQGRVEGVDVVRLREVLQDVRKLLVVRGLRELHLPHVKTTDTRDRVTRMHHRRRLTLSLRKKNVDHLLR